MSICVEYSEDPSSTSGGRYQSVTTSLEYVLVGTDLALARPVEEKYDKIKNYSMDTFCINVWNSHAGLHWKNWSKETYPIQNLKNLLWNRPNTVFVFTKVSQLEFPSVIDEQILGFQVSVKNFPSVTVRQASQDLEQKNLEAKKTYFRSVNHCKLLLGKYNTSAVLNSKCTTAGWSTHDFVVLPLQWQYYLLYIYITILNYGLQILISILYRVNIKFECS